MEDELRIHLSPFSEWYATQDTSAGGVWICDKSSDRKVLVQPPVEWGSRWSWNVTEDGSGIYFKHDFA